MNPVFFLGHKVKGQGKSDILVQTKLLEKGVRFGFWKFVGEWMIPNDFMVIWSKVNFKVTLTLSEINKASF